MEESPGARVRNILNPDDVLAASLSHTAEVCCPGLLMNSLVAEIRQYQALVVQ